MQMVYCVFGKVSNGLGGYNNILMCVCSSKEKAIEKVAEYKEKYKTSFKTTTFYYEMNYVF